MKNKMYWITALTLGVYFGMMVFVAFIAFTHRSGITKIDIAKLHLLRVASPTQDKP